MDKTNLPKTLLVRMETPMLAISDTVMTDRHHRSPEENYDERDPQNIISGTIPPFSLNGWFRHGMERFLQEKYGVTVCHPTEANGNFQREEVLERDLSDGYHEKGSCLEEEGGNGPCLVADLFGGFERRPGKFMREPIQFTPVRSSVDFTEGQAEAHYRRTIRHVASRNEEDHRVPFRNVELDLLANIDGTWRLELREKKPEYIAAIAGTVQFLNNHRRDFMHQLGGGKNFGAGIVETDLVNPLYDETDVSNLFNRARSSKTGKMEEKDEKFQNLLSTCIEEMENRIQET